jgi:DNA-binding CsgD family transcriptional regulator
VLDLNPAAADLLGREAGTLNGLRLDDLLTDESRARCERGWGRLVRAGQRHGRLFLEGVGGKRVGVHYSATAGVGDDLHLLILVPTPAANGTPHARRGARLSAREREVLTRLAGGSQGHEIAEELAIAPETVRRHVANAREKLGARSRVHAVAIAIARGEINA